MKKLLILLALSLLFVYSCGEENEENKDDNTVSLSNVEGIWKDNQESFSITENGCNITEKKAKSSLSYFEIKKVTESTFEYIDCLNESCEDSLDESKGVYDFSDFLSINTLNPKDKEWSFKEGKDNPGLDCILTFSSVRNIKFITKTAGMASDVYEITTSGQECVEAKAWFNENIDQDDDIRYLTNVFDSGSCTIKVSGKVEKL